MRSGEAFDWKRINFVLEVPQLYYNNIIAYYIFGAWCPWPSNGHYSFCGWYVLIVFQTTFEGGYTIPNPASNFYSFCFWGEGQKCGGVPWAQTRTEPAAPCRSQWRQPTTLGWSSWKLTKRSSNLKRSCHLILSWRVCIPTVSTVRVTCSLLSLSLSLCLSLSPSLPPNIWYIKCMNQDLIFAIWSLEHTQQIYNIL